jgi:PAS domain S-box-containing protein
VPNSDLAYCSAWEGRTLEQSVDGQSIYELSWKCPSSSKAVITIPHGTILDCNPAAESLLGKSRADIVGRSVHEFVPPSERSRATYELLRLTEEPVQYDDFHLLDNKGRKIPIAVSSSGVIKLGGRTPIAVIEFRDVSLEKQQEYRLAAQRWALSAYAAAAVALSQQHAACDLYAAICKAIVTEPTYVLAWVGIAEQGPGRPIRLVARAGPGGSILEGLSLSWSEDDPSGQGPTPVAIRTEQLQTIHDLRELQVFSTWAERAREFGIRSIISIPFQVGNGAEGALVVCASKPRAFEADATDVFTHLAEQLCHGICAIEQRELLEKERQNVVEAERRTAEAMSLMLTPMSLAMELRDPYTAGHQNRVAEIAVAIAGEMGWSSERLAGLRLAAQVHDIGKMSIPADILTKQGRLSNAERALLNEHCENGFNILKGIPFPWPIATIVLQHHEKLDGSGYPHGLIENDILPEARILAVADIFEAMANYRPYRPAIPMEAVLAQLESQSGAKLDAAAVGICASLCRRGRFVNLFARSPFN